MSLNRTIAFLIPVLVFMGTGIRKDGRPNSLPRAITWEVENAPRYTHLSPCWNVTSHVKDETGRAGIIIRGKRIRLHKFVFIQHFGEIPAGMVVRHKCDNPSCVNPEHLELGTQADNVHDCVARGRNAKGEVNGHAKLREDDVRTIHALLVEGTLTTREIASRFAVNATMITQIKCGHSWKHLGLSKINGYYKAANRKLLRGEERSRSLTEEKVREIRASALSRSRLALQYGVSKSCIQSILERKTWQHIV